jgi:hypothetical protein
MVSTPETYPMGPLVVESAYRGIVSRAGKE